MSRKAPYSNAPITEALIDIQVTLPEEITVSDLARVEIGEETGYPYRQNRFAIEGQIAVGEQIGTSTRQTHVGYRFLTGDERQIVQVRSDGFTFSRLKPYDCWETFREEAYRMWERYRAVAKPVSTNRVAVRYINRLDIPLPIEDFKDYLRTVPEVSSDLSQELNGYLMQLAIPQDDLRSTVLLNEALIPPASKDIVSILLDIDLFREIELPIKEEELWKLLDQFRIRKNEVFEACITERTRELLREED